MSIGGASFYGRIRASPWGLFAPRWPVVEVPPSPCKQAPHSRRFHSGGTLAAARPRSVCRSPFDDDSPRQQPPLAPPRCGVDHRALLHRAGDRPGRRVLLADDCRPADVQLQRLRHRGGRARPERDRHYRGRFQAGNRQWFSDADAFAFTDAYAGPFAFTGLGFDLRSEPGGLCRTATQCLSCASDRSTHPSSGCDPKPGSQQSADGFRRG